MPPVHGAFDPPRARRPLLPPRSRQGSGGSRVPGAGARVGPDGPTGGPGGAEALVADYVRAFATRDYVAAAGALDPEELAEFAGLLAVLSNQMGGAGTFEVDPDAPPAEVLASFLTSTTQAEPLMGEAMESLRADVVGSVAEGDSLRHVVVRSRFDLAGAPSGGVQLTTARWDGER